MPEKRKRSAYLPIGIGIQFAYLIVLGIIDLEVCMISKALVAASAKPIILAMLMSGENYGYQILKRVSQVSGGKLDWSEALLYPVLHRLEKDGLVVAQWKISEGNRLRKYYRLTAAGKKELLAEKENWLSVHQALQHLWEPAVIKN
jgi:DNA-binding PadR family transcriptional regulator